MTGFKIQGWVEERNPAFGGLDVLGYAIANPAYSLVHKAGSATPTFGATFSGTVTDAGQQLYQCAVQAGFGKGTHLHGVGDAPKGHKAQRG
jgi:hypothetical protein